MDTKVMSGGDVALSQSSQTVGPSSPSQPAGVADLMARITNYLSSGGLEHDKVRELLIACRDYLCRDYRPSAGAATIAEIAAERDARRSAEKGAALLSQQLAAERDKAALAQGAFEVECQEYQTEIDQQAATVLKGLTRIVQLEEQLAASEKDKARLDWLGTNIVAFDVRNYKARITRAAIDDAMNK